MLVGAIYALVGDLGFNPTDEGLVAALAQRILHGQVPHRDFITPRPAGSALLHVVDYALPMALLPAGRLLCVIEVVAYSLLLACVIFDRPFWRFSPLQHLGTAASALVNLHTFPLMSWYTTDGILLSAAGAVLVRPGVNARRRRWRTGLVLLGAAVVTKQSFFAAPLLGVGWLVLSAPRSERLRVGIQAAACAALAPVAYVLWVTVAGGFQDMKTQLTSSAATWGQPLFVHAVPWIGLPVLILAWAAARRGGPILRFGAALLVIAWATYAALASDLQWAGNWGSPIWGAAVAATILTYVNERRVDAGAIAVIALGWMVSLSYGDPVPDLVAGSLALVVAASPVAAALAHGRRVRAGVAFAAAVATVVCAVVFVQTRRDHPYADRPAAQLNATLRSYSADFGSLRTNAVTAAYVGNVVHCVRRYPAPSVAVLGDNAALYPALHLHNPFPIDWLWPGDYAGSENRLLRSATQLDRRGGYLVLIQAVSNYQLPTFRSLPRPRPRIPTRTSLIEFPMVRRLHGRQFPCGTFLAIYQPKLNGTAHA